MSRWRRPPADGEMRAMAVDRIPQAGVLLRDRWHARTGIGSEDQHKWSAEFTREHVLACASVRE